MSRKHKNVCENLNCSQQFLILSFTITGCISISCFASLIGVPIGSTTYAWFTYRTWGPFKYDKGSIQKSKEIRNSRYTYQNKLDKACF